MHAQFTTWYAIALISVLTLLALFSILRSFIQLLASLVTYFILKYLIYSHANLLKVLRIRTTLFDILLAIVFTVGNVICLAWGVHSAKQLSIRSASLLATNLILLLPGASITADTIRISLRTYERYHRIVGIIALAEGVLHSVLELTEREWKGNIQSLSGIVAVASLAVVCISSLKIARSRIYEIFRAIHVIGSTIICTALCIHTTASRTLPRIQAIAGSSVWVATLLHRNCLVVYRNFSFEKSRTTIMIENVFGVLKVFVTLPRPWRIRPGQYIYLTVARTGLLSIFQRHPFLVAASQIGSFELRIQPRSGFTRRLLEIVPGSGPAHYDAIIEGPYGHEFDFREFGTILMIASGIGITSYLSYIETLLQDHEKFKIKTRDILLIWYARSGDRNDLVAKFMDKLLTADRPIEEDYGSGKGSTRQGPSSDGVNNRKSMKSKRRVPDRPGRRPIPSGEDILDIYVYRDDLEVPMESAGERVAQVQGSPNIPEIILDVLETRDGKVAVTVCAEISIKRTVQETVAANMRKNVRFVELEFQPFEQEEQYIRRKRSLSVECRGLDNNL